MLQETEKLEAATSQQRQAVQQQGSKELKQLQGDIGLQRQAAVNKRDAEIGMAQQQIDEAKRQQMQITRDLQDNFQRARQQNTAGINQLLESGVLVKKASVSGGRR